MAKCKDCGQDMSVADTCTHDKIVIQGQLYDRDTTRYDVGERCHDCGIENHNDHIHHFGCDMEECPVHPGRQFMGCCMPHTEALVSDRGLNVVVWEPRSNWLHGKARVK